MTKNVSVDVRHLEMLLNTCEKVSKAFPPTECSRWGVLMIDEGPDRFSVEKQDDIGKALGFYSEENFRSDINVFAYQLPCLLTYDRQMFRSQPNFPHQAKFPIYSCQSASAKVIKNSHCFTQNTWRQDDLLDFVKDRLPASLIVESEGDRLDFYWNLKIPHTNNLKWLADQMAVKRIFQDKVQTLENSEIIPMAVAPFSQEKWLKTSPTNIISIDEKMYYAEF